MKTRLQLYGILQFCIIIITLTLTSCRKFVQIDPPISAIASSTVYSTNSSASAAMNSIYSNMIVYPAMSSGYPSIGYLMGLASDELTNFDPTNIGQVQFYQNELTGLNPDGSSNYYFWTELYNEIYVSNAILTGLGNSNGVSPSLKQQLSGEAKFMRAFLHFYATNLYGDVPVVTTTNYLVNNSISASTQSQVFQQIVADLMDAKSQLPAGFVDGSGKPSSLRVRPNRGAAIALLARAYLYQAKWDSAEASATTLIDNSSVYGLDSLSNVFLGTSLEAIWQLEPVNPTNNTYDAQFYVLLGEPGPGNNSVALSTSLTNSFESGDQRFTNWVGAFTSDSITYYYYPNKYKVWQTGDPTIPVTEYTMVLRLAEQYLIRAEARARQGKLTGNNSAIADLNAIRNRAWLANYSGPTDQQSVLTAIQHERQIELFTEWGHRWFDLKRTGNLNTVMGAPGNICQAKGGAWSSDWSLLPIAVQELHINPKLKQNPGYSN